jgi:hypothetical protein
LEFVEFIIAYYYSDYYSCYWLFRTRKPTLQYINPQLLEDATLNQLPKGSPALTSAMLTEILCLNSEIVRHANSLGSVLGSESEVLNYEASNSESSNSESSTSESRTSESQNPHSAKFTQLGTAVFSSGSLLAQKQIAQFTPTNLVKMVEGFTRTRLKSAQSVGEENTQSVGEANTQSVGEANTNSQSLAYSPPSPPVDPYFMTLLVFQLPRIGESANCRREDLLKLRDCLKELNVRSQAVYLLLDELIQERSWQVKS